jgi:hypothetical protein
MPVAQFESGSPRAPSVAIRQSIIGYLSGPSIEAIPITALLQSRADEEAAQKDSDFVRASTITQERPNAGGGI